MLRTEGERVTRAAQVLGLRARDLVGFTFLQFLFLASSAYAFPLKDQRLDGEIAWDATKPDGTPRKLMSGEKLKAMGWTPSDAHAP